MQKEIEMITFWQVYFHTTGAVYCRTFNSEEEATKFYDSMKVIDKRAKIQKQSYQKD